MSGHSWANEDDMARSIVDAALDSRIRPSRTEITDEMVERAFVAYQRGAVMRVGTPQDWMRAALDAAEDVRQTYERELDEAERARPYDPNGD